MSWFKKLFGTRAAHGVSRSTVTQADGSLTSTTSFRLGADNLRPVRDGVVAAMDEALGRFGEVQHALDPARMVSFQGGGPPVWSIGVVLVDAPRPYWLWVTYGFSARVSPIAYREGFTHEYSIAVPADDALPPVWPAALLRHLCRYILTNQAELRVGDHIPFHHPITQVAFAAEHHASLPSSPLTAVLVGEDPDLPQIQTPSGPISVRRIVGLDSRELEVLQRWSGTAFFQTMTRHVPGMVSDGTRGSLLDEAAFTEEADRRIHAEGSSLGALFMHGGWHNTTDSVDIVFPGGVDARQIRRVLDARIPFGRPLILRGPPDLGPVRFEPGEDFEIYLDGDVLVFHGNLDHPQMAPVLQSINPERDQGRIVIPR